MQELSFGQIRIVPLGGLGEIGMNCLAIEQADGILVVDCGITFPRSDVGIDTIHPLFTYLEEHREKISGVFLTHGHEDHVGGLPFLLRRIDTQVFGPPHALAVAEHRIAEYASSVARRFVRAEPRALYRVGPFEVEPIRVSHSIVEATALAIRTSAGLVVHTGDFKFDPTPPDGEPTDEARLADLGRQGVRLLLSDSTNIDARSDPGSEAGVGEALDRLIRQARERVVVALFASNVQRLRLLGEIAKKRRRKIALFGRSLQLHVEAALAIGRLGWPSDLVVPSDEAASMPRDRLLVLAGGTQAEPGSALSRMAAGTHPLLTIDEGDTVIFSSRIIPGNDPPVFDLMASLLRRGAVVKNWITDPDVHVSGHAHRSEQRKMIDLLSPHGFIPVHGTLHHLTRHAELARAAGVPEVLVIENGQTALVDEHAVSLGESVAVGRVATCGGREIASSVLKEREALGRGGVAHVTIIVDRGGRLLEPPIVVARGVHDETSAPAALRAAARRVAESIEGRPWGGVAEPSDEVLGEIAKSAVRRALEDYGGRRPAALATVVRR